LPSSKTKVELAKTPAWRHLGKSIARSFVFDDFSQAMKFVNHVSRLAEAVNHHPDITIQYNKVKLTLTTHDEGGLTMKDFRLARKIDQLERKPSRF